MNIGSPFQSFKRIFSVYNAMSTLILTNFILTRKKVRKKIVCEKCFIEILNCTNCDKYRCKNILIDHKKTNTIGGRMQK